MRSSVPPRLDDRCMICGIGRCFVPTRPPSQRGTRLGLAFFQTVITEGFFLCTCTLVPITCFWLFLRLLLRLRLAGAVGSPHLWLSRNHSRFRFLRGSGPPLLSTPCTG